SGFISTGIAIALALFELFGELPKKIHWLINPPVQALNGIHSGQIGDYIAWVVVGVSTFGLVLTLKLLHG
ncbi:MAG: hypothetical protein ACREP6_13865, partial [Candidatus Binataceae bacterium]